MTRLKNVRALDQILGDEGNNELVGTDAGDVIRGGLGNDRIDGRGGADWASYLDAAAAVTVDLASGKASGGAGKDVLVNIEGVYGSVHDDRIVGSTRLVFEFFDGRAGDDRIDGGKITDIDLDRNQNRVVYDSDPAGIDVNLATGVARDGWGGKDTLKNINQVWGSSFDDKIVGSSAAGFELFFGNRGDDVIDGGRLVGESYNGVSYQFAGGSVTVDLKSGTADDGNGGTDTLRNINWVRGSEADDTLRGSNRTHGVETLIGGLGDDLLDGRGGLDVARYDGAPSAVTVDLARGVADGGHGHDTLRNIERVRGSAFADTLLGSDSARVTESFQGMGGNDLIDGGGGFDIVGFGRSLAAVTVKLGGAAAGTARDGMGGRDTLRAIEGVVGSIFDDTLTGSNAKGLETFDGGKGLDTLRGGRGPDSFIFSTALGKSNVDRIVDFNAADDQVQLSADVFKAAGPAGVLARSAFHVGSKAHDANDRVIYDSANGRLYYDADGNGSGAAIEFATVTKATPMTAADFWIA